VRWSNLPDTLVNVLSDETFAGDHTLTVPPLEQPALFVKQADCEDAKIISQLQGGGWDYGFLGANKGRMSWTPHSDGTSSIPFCGTPSSRIAARRYASQMASILAAMSVITSVAPPPMPRMRASR
jgi:hypothetical protein